VNPGGKPRSLTQRLLAQAWGSSGPTAPSNRSSRKETIPDPPSTFSRHTPPRSYRSASKTRYPHHRSRLGQTDRRSQKFANPPVAIVRPQALNFAFQSLPVLRGSFERDVWNSAHTRQHIAKVRFECPIITTWLAARSIGPVVLKLAVSTSPIAPPPRAPPRHHIEYFRPGLYDEPRTKSGRSTVIVASPW
jgi:hypothetical protein